MSKKIRFVLLSFMYMLVPTLFSLVIGYVHWIKGITYEAGVTNFYEALKGIILPLLYFALMYFFLSTFFELKKAAENYKFILITALTGSVAGLVLEHLAWYFCLQMSSSASGFLFYLWGMPWLWVVMIISTLFSWIRSVKRSEAKD